MSGAGRTGADRTPLSFSEAPGRFAVRIVPADPGREVVVDLPAGATWDDYFDAIKRAGDVELGPGGWLVQRHRRLDG